MARLREKLASYINLKKEVDFSELLESTVEQMRIFISKKLQVVDILYPFQGLPPEQANEQATAAVKDLEGLILQILDFLDAMEAEGFIESHIGSAVEAVWGDAGMKHGVSVAFENPATDWLLLENFDKSVSLVKEIQ